MEINKLPFFPLSLSLPFFLLDSAPACLLPPLSWFSGVVVPPPLPEIALGTHTRTRTVDECEIKVIKETFKDLCHLKGGSARIDKETFLQYFPLPGLLGGEVDAGDWP